MNYPTVLSIYALSKGKEAEKIMWSFKFFDLDQDGQITREEMVKVSYLELSWFNHIVPERLLF